MADTLRKALWDAAVRAVNPLHGALEAVDSFLAGSSPYSPKSWREESAAYKESVRRRQDAEYNRLLEATGDPRMAREMLAQSEGIHATGDEMLPFTYGPLAFNLARAGVRGLPKITQTVKNIRDPNVTARGFVKDPATGKEGLFAHGTTKRNVKFSELDPAAKHVTDSGYLSEGLYGGVVNPSRGIGHNFNLYSLRATPNQPGMVALGGKSGPMYTPMQENFYKLAAGKTPWGNPTTHFYRLKGKPYVHGKMPVSEMKKINSTISKLREANPKMSLPEIKTRALRKHGYEVEVFDPKVAGSLPRHPAAPQMAPQGIVPMTEAVALTPQSIAPRWNPSPRPLPVQQLALPVIGSQ